MAIASERTIWSLNSKEVLRLRCLVQGDYTTFVIELGVNDELDVLRTKITEQRSLGVLRDVRPADLIIFKVSYR